MKWNDVSPEKYEIVKSHVQWETNPPKGLLLHSVGFSGGNVYNRYLGIGGGL